MSAVFNSGKNFIDHTISLHDHTISHIEIACDSVTVAVTFSNYCLYFFRDQDGSLRNTYLVLEELGLREVATETDCKVLRFLCEVLSIRAAQLISCGTLHIYLLFIYLIQAVFT